MFVYTIPFSFHFFFVPLFLHLISILATTILSPPTDDPKIVMDPPRGPLTKLPEIFNQCKKDAAAPVPNKPHFPEDKDLPKFKMYENPVDGKKVLESPGLHTVGIKERKYHSNKAHINDKGRYQLPIGTKTVLEFKNLRSFPQCFMCGCPVSPCDYVISVETGVGQPCHCERCQCIATILTKQYFLPIIANINNTIRMKSLMWQVIYDHDSKEKYPGIKKELSKQPVNERISYLIDADKAKTPFEYSLLRTALFELNLDERLKEKEGKQALTAFDYVMKNVRNVPCFSDVRLKEATGGKSEDFINYFYSKVDDIANVIRDKMIACQSQDHPLYQLDVIVHRYLTHPVPKPLELNGVQERAIRETMEDIYQKLKSNMKPPTDLAEKQTEMMKTYKKDFWPKLGIKGD